MLALEVVDGLLGHGGLETHRGILRNLANRLELVQVRIDDAPVDAIDAVGYLRIIVGQHAVERLLIALVVHLRGLDARRLDIDGRHDRSQLIPHMLNTEHVRKQ